MFSIFSRPRSSRLIAFLIWLPAVVSFIAALYFIFFTNRLYFHSDSADLQMWAEQVLSSGRPLSFDFHYAEPRQIFNYHLFALPWLAFAPASMMGHSIATGIYCSLFFIATLWSLKRLGMSDFARSITTALIFSTPSHILSDMFWGELAYGWESFFTILLVGFAFRRQLDRTADLPYRSGSTFYYCIFFITILLFCLNGSRPVLIYFAPVLGALLFRGVFINPSQYISYYRSVMPYVMLMIAACAAGIIFMRVITAGISFPISGITQAYGATELRSVLSLLPLQYLNVLNGIPPPSVNVNSFIGIGYFVNTLFAILLLIGAGVLTRNYDKLNTATQYLIIGFWITTIAVTYPFAMCLANHSNWLDVARYLIPSVFFLFLLFGSFLDYIKAQNKILLYAVCICCTLLPITQGIYFLTSYNSESYKNHAHERLIKFVLDHDIHYGYATYWNATVLTVRSGSQLKIRPVLIDPELTEFPFHSASSWYDPEYAVTASCLILTLDEEHALRGRDDKPVWKIIQQAAKRLENDNYVIYIFNGNLSKNIKPQSLTYPTAHWNGSDLPGNVGRVDGTNRLATAATDGFGVLTYGPYITLRGLKNYKIMITYSAFPNGNEIVGYWDAGVFSNRILPMLKMDFENGENRIVEKLITIPASGVENFEVRSFFSGKGRLIIHSIEIEKVQ